MEREKTIYGTNRPPKSPERLLKNREDKLKNQEIAIMLGWVEVIRPIKGNKNGKECIYWQSNKGKLSPYLYFSQDSCWHDMVLKFFDKNRFGFICYKNFLINKFVCDIKKIDEQGNYTESFFDEEIIGIDRRETMFECFYQFAIKYNLNQI